MKTLLLLVTLLLFLRAESRWIWEDLEVIGNKNATRAQIHVLAPVKIGEPYEQKPEIWNYWCSKIKEQYEYVYANCSALRYSDGKAYLVIDVVEKGDEERVAFRSVPNENRLIATKEIIAQYSLLQKRRYELFTEGRDVRENASKGYLDFSEPELSKIVDRLVKLVPSHRENLLKVIEFDQNPDKRGQAATLLNWALDTEKSIKKVHSFLDDPSSLVRNNISRFMLHYFPQVKDESVLSAVIPSLARQLNYPSHGDRNKAIFGLLNIAQSHPPLRPLIKEKVEKQVRSLIKNSVLGNVQGTAKDLEEIYNR